MNVRQLEPERAHYLLQKGYDAGIEVRFLRGRDDACLVSSESKPGVWHFATAESCDCEWFRYRELPCKHMVRADRELAIRRLKTNTFYSVG